jgi:hypothetical protein
MEICSFAACLRIEDLFRPICSAIWALLKPCPASFLSCSSSSGPNRSGCLTVSLIPILGALFRMADSLRFRRPSALFSFRRNLIEQNCPNKTEQDQNPGYESRVPEQGVEHAHLQIAPINVGQEQTGRQCSSR